MAGAKHHKPAPVPEPASEPELAPAPASLGTTPEPPGTADSAGLVPPDAQPAPQPELPAVPTSAEEETPQEEAGSEAGSEPLPKEYVVLDGAASFGPVIMGGTRVQARKGRLYYVPDAEERVDILGTGRFRVATQLDLVRAGSPSAGPGGAITRDLLPEGAVKGGLSKP